jgi:predicted enzyme related to lactoylglutathione lyase
MAIVPTTDLARAKPFYGETLGLAEANLPTTAGDLTATADRTGEDQSRG